jgi:hypothetical protein
LTFGALPQKELRVKMNAMTDRSKTALIIGTASLIMFSPLAISLLGHPIPLFQNLGFEKEYFHGK